MKDINASRYTARKIVLRVIAAWIINALGLIILSDILDDFTLGSFSTALVISAVLGLLNALIWPFLARLTLPISVLTLGAGSLVANGFFVIISMYIIPQNADVYIKGWGTGLVVALGISIINSLFTRLLSIDDDDFYYRNVIKHQARKQKFRSSDKSERTGVIFLQIDGLGYSVLQRAMRNGSVPNMARWLRQGSHRLMRWECDWSSQTGAMQTGILHGDNWDMPAFRWYEKDRSKAMISNRPKDAAEIERRHSNGKGLLHYDGSSRANLVSGDAAHSMITLSNVLRKRLRASTGQDYMAFFSNPYSSLRILVMIIGEIVREIYQQVVQARRDVQPRIHRGLFPYPLLRAFTNVLQRELGISGTIQDIYAGRPVTYSMFLGYDEVSHHSGIERAETLKELEKIDRAFGRLEQAIKEAPRKYEMVVLADHGQTQGATFKQRYGISLEEFVESLTGLKTSGSNVKDEGISYVHAASLEISRKKGFLSLISKILKSHPEEMDKKKSEIIVLASGGLGCISFTHKPKRISLEFINQLYPNLIKGLVQHEGIAFLLVRSKKEGDMVIGKKGTYYLKTGKIKGTNPLASFGPNAAKHVSRTSSFPHCPDIVINASYWQEIEETAAFEELVGSHGAMGGSQQYPFILYPASFKYPYKEIVGAEKVHMQFRKWLVDLGWESYKTNPKNKI